MRANRILVRQKREQPKLRGKGSVDAPGKIVMVGGGAAGFAAAEMLKRQEFGGCIVIYCRDVRFHESCHNGGIHLGFSDSHIGRVNP
jgi:hypothetical protein